MASRIGILLLLMVCLIRVENLYSQSDIWVGSWSCAPYAAGSNNTPPSPYLANNTLRQIVRVSIGGNTLRVKFSNKTSPTAVTMNSVNIAVSSGGSAVDASTITPLKFNGNQSVTMDAYSSVTSDPVTFALTPGARVAITIYYGQAASTADITCHVGSRTDSYILSGDQSSSATFSGAVVTAHWYHINTIDVVAPSNAGCVGVIGNSITDGYGLSGGLQNRWPDVFSQQLLNDTRTNKIGVLNLGIGGTNVSGFGATTGASRYVDDILSQKGLRWVIVFYGVNDIGGGASATTIISAYQKMISDAHLMGLKIYGATITPFNGNGYYSVAHEAVRNTVNEWIRTPGNFDACIDFDKAIRDPNDNSKLLAAYSNDWLHPNVAGYAKLGQSVSLDLFTDVSNITTVIANAGADQTVIDLDNAGSRSVTLSGKRSYVFGGEPASYEWRKDEDLIGTGESPAVDLAVGTHVITLTIFDKDGNTDTDEVSINVLKDAGVWLEAECGTVGSLWNIESDNQASNGKYVTVKPGNTSSNTAPSNSTGLITYVFNVEESGNYEMFARLICPTANDDSFWVKMDNGNFVMWNGISAPSWQWHRYTSGFSLSKGTHTLTIGYREDGAKLDKLWITPISAELLDAGSDASNCNGLSSIKNSEMKKLSVDIFPNPIEDQLNVKLPFCPAHISLFDINGKMLFRQFYQNPDVTVDMSSIQSNIYFLEVVGQQQTIVTKVVKR
jgi:lysophospholipase L1-like esterase